MEAILIAGGKGERLGEAARGMPKALVRLAGRPLAAYHVRLLVQAGVDRVLISCAAGKGALFGEELGGLGADIVPVEEPEPLGRGGGVRNAAKARREHGDLYALNGDDLLDVDLRGLLDRHRNTAAAATIAVAPLRIPLGVVELADDDLVVGFKEAPQLAEWVNSGVYVLGAEALARMPERGDHEASTFPELAAEGRLRGFRHEGVWLPVNTSKELRLAEEYLRTHPEWPGF